MRQEDFKGAIEMFKRAFDIYNRLEYPTPGATQLLGNHPMCSSIAQTMSRAKAMIAAREERKREASGSSAK